MSLYQYITFTYGKGKSFSFKDLAKHYPHKESIQVQLSRLNRNGRIIRQQKGYYMIPTKEMIRNNINSHNSLIHEKKRNLFFMLKQRAAFWSGSSDNPQEFNEEDDQELIGKSLLYLELEEMDMLFDIYPYKKVKQHWLHHYVPQPDRYNTLNLILGIKVFHIYNIKSYLKRYGKKRTS